MEIQFGHAKIAKNFRKTCRPFCWIFPFRSVRPTIMENFERLFLAIIFVPGSFEAPEITASEIRGVHYGF